MKRLLFSMLFISTISFGQQSDTLTIFDFYKMVEQNSSIQKNYNLSEKIGTINVENIKIKKFPVVNFKAQTTYQSDVIEFGDIFSSFPPNIPTPQIESIPKNQYKLYVEANQLIYNGGIVKSMEKLENAKSQAEMQKVNIDVYSLKNKINENYYNILLLQKKEEIINLFSNEIKERIKVLISALDNGIITKSDLDGLRAELLTAEQQLIEIHYTKNNLFFTLYQLTGINEINEAYLKLPIFAENADSGNYRPEINLFNAEKEKLDLTEELLMKKKYPLIAGFGQFGYARPGLNILNPNLTDYYLVGLSLKWNIWDWGEMKKNKQRINLTKEIINNQEENFRKSIATIIGVERTKLLQIKEMMLKDDEIIDLKEQIAKESSNALENGTKTATDYLTDLNAEKRARLNKVIHEIEFSKTEINYRTALGQIKNE